MSEGPMGESSLAAALASCDELEAELGERGMGTTYMHLTNVRRALRSQALLLARCSGALRATALHTETGRQIVRDIAAVVPGLMDSAAPVYEDLIEERPVPGPTPNRPEDRVL